MTPFSVVMKDELLDGYAKSPIAKQNQSIKAFFFDGPNETLCMCRTVWGSRRHANTLHIIAPPDRRRSLPFGKGTFCIGETLSLPRRWPRFLTTLQQRFRVLNLALDRTSIRAYYRRNSSLDGRWRWKTNNVVGERCYAALFWTVMTGYSVRLLVL